MSYGDTLWTSDGVTAFIISHSEIEKQREGRAEKHAETKELVKEACIDYLTDKVPFGKLKKIVDEAARELG